MGATRQAAARGRHARAQAPQWDTALTAAIPSRTLRSVALLLVIAAFLVLALAAAAGCAVARAWRGLGPRRQLAAGAALAMLAARVAGDAGVIPDSLTWTAVTGMVLAAVWVALASRAQDRQAEQQAERQQREWVRTGGRGLNAAARAADARITANSAQVGALLARVAALEDETAELRSGYADMSGRVAAFRQALLLTYATAGEPIPVMLEQPAERSLHLVGREGALCTA